MRRYYILDDYLVFVGVWFMVVFVVYSYLLLYPIAMIISRMIVWNSEQMPPAAVRFASSTLTWI